MTSVVQLHQKRPCDDVSATLRRIADQIEAGDIDWPVTTAVLILGHTDAETRVDDGALAEQSYWTTFAMGPRCGTFTVRGLVSSAIRQWNFNDD